MLRPGETVRGYTVAAPLGEGGMATVYAATRDVDGVPVALKVLHAGRRDLAHRARTEARAQQQLTHAHVVQVFEVIDVRELPGLVMERVNGPSLRQWLDARRPSTDDAMALFRGVLAGVEHAHEHGLVHRDLKPSNVLLALTEQGVVPKVADFGLAKLAEPGEHATRTGVMLGTPGYMAPEQIRDAKRADARADVFSLGVLLYEMVCGRAPFTGADVIGAYQDMISRSYPDPGTLGAPPTVAAAIRAALEPDPEDRPAHAGALRIQLDPGATFAEGAAAVVVLPWSTEGAERARSMSTIHGAAVDPTRPALRTPIVAPEGGLVGREEELTRLARQVDNPGLVTLKGPPGVGKTALAQAVARSEGGRPGAWGGGVWWVDLRDSPAEAAVARALGIPQGNDIGASIAGRGRLLLVLDEAEHDVQAARESVSAWLGDAQQLTVLATSRVLLGVGDERSVDVAPLSKQAAMGLFLRRASAARRGWAPTAEERGQIAQLVDRLDGLPLAIELAAARLKLLAPRDLLRRIEKRLDVLRSRGADPRTASLRGAIDSSWDLLEPEERRALTWLAMARGSVAPAAAEELLEQVHPDPTAVVEQLVDSSWLTIRDEADGRRYAMLESLRVYVREQPSPEEAAAAAEAHARVWIARADDAMSRFEAGGDGGDLLALEVDDLLQIGERMPGTEAGWKASLLAARWLFERGDQRRALPAAERAAAWVEELGLPPAETLTVQALVVLRGDSSRGIEIARRALAVAHDEPSWIRAATALGASEEADATSVPLLEQAIGRARALGDGVLEAKAWVAKSIAQTAQGDYRGSEASAEEALALYREAGHHPEQARALSLVGLSRIRDQRAEQAEAPLREAATVSGGAGDRRQQAAALGRLSMVQARAGRRDDARKSLEQALALSSQLGDVVGEGYCLANMGAIEPDPSRAAELFRRAGVAARRAGHRPLESLAQRNLGASELLRGFPERAVEPFRRAVELTPDRGDALRVRGWYAIALAANGRLDDAEAELDGLVATGEDARILELVRVGLSGVRSGTDDWKTQADTIADSGELTWDLRLTRNLLATL